MQRMHTWAWLVALTAAAWTGCGSSNSTNSVEATATSTVDPAKDPRDPKQVLSDFVDLKRSGDHAAADKLLSAKACDVLQRVQLSIVNMPADNSVKCVIGEAEVVENGNGAHVETVWSKGEGNDSERLKTLWVLRNDASGWRVVGVILPPMSFDPTKKPEPFALDFEDEQQIRGFQALMTPPPPAAATAGADVNSPTGGASTTTNTNTGGANTVASPGTQPPGANVPGNGATPNLGPALGQQPPAETAAKPMPAIGETTKQ